LFPKLEVPGDKIKPEQVCKDPEIVNQYATDPLVYHGSIKARFGEQSIKVK
jgi:hypothetical protein